MNPKHTGVSVGISVGVCFGVALGTATQDVAVGFALGVGLGTALALTFGAFDEASTRKKVALHQPLPHPLGLLSRDDTRS